MVETRIYDDIDRHMAVAGSFERAGVPPGFFLAWLANLQLVSAGFQRTAESDLTRLRLRDLTPGEFFIKNCHGRLTAAALNERGQQFTESYYADRYMSDLAEVFGKASGDDPALYDITDDWDHYDRIAPVITRRFFAAGRNPPPKPRGSGWLRLITGGRKD